MRQRQSHNGARQGAGATTSREDARGSIPGDTTGQPGHEAVARRAYEIYLGRGAEGGSELEDWFRAEAELRGGQ